MMENITASFDPLITSISENIFLQIGMGLLPAALFLFILLIARRAFRPFRILFAALAIGICIACFGIGLHRQPAEPEQKPDAEEELPPLTREDYLNFAAALFLEEDYPEASLVLSECEARFGYDMECRLFEARLLAAKGNTEDAEAICRYIQTHSDLLKDAGGEIPEQLERETLYKTVEESFQINDGYYACADAVSELSASWQEETKSSTGSGEPEYAGYEDLVETIEEEAPELLQLECVSNARLKGRLAAGDYELIAEDISASSSAAELIAASQLYVDGILEEDDFTKAEGSEIGAFIRECLLALLEEEEQKESSKINLALARLSHFEANEEDTDKYLNAAIYSADLSLDETYASAMSGIRNILEGGGSPDDIKHVTGYMKRAMEHSQTVNLTPYQIRRMNRQSGGADGSAKAYSLVRLSTAAPEAEPEAEGEDEEEEFTRIAADYVSRKLSALAIGRIDAAKFPKVRAKITVSDTGLAPEELKQKLELYDCGSRIQDFTLEKCVYSRSDIRLICDVSYSMEGSIGDLQEAVKSFLMGKDAKERIGLITFCSLTKENLAVGSHMDELLAAVDRMSADSGTDMFHPTLDALQDFSTERDVNRLILLMTDGQDNSPASLEEIYGELGGFASNNDVSVYTLGLGPDVDTGYLSAIADACGGEFVYVSDSESLKSFYDRLHAQLYDQYEITYEAADTFTRSDRTLEILLRDENLRESKLYSLEGEASEEEQLPVYQDFSISGVSPRFITKSHSDTEIRLTGTGFAQETKLSLTLNGDVDYSPELKYQDPNTCTFKVPKDIAVGSYDVVIQIGAKKKVIPDGFTVIKPGEMKAFSFGPYTFTASQILRVDDMAVLRGAVSMNGWLHFNGEVRLEGDPSDASRMTLSEDHGSYVVMDGPDPSGLAKLLRDKSLAVNIGAVHEMTLYYDQEHLYNEDYEDYKVDSVEGFNFVVPYVLTLELPGISFYPDRIGMHSHVGNINLPNQKKVIQSVNPKARFFSFEWDTDLVVTRDNVGVKLKIEYEDKAESSKGKGKKETATFLNTKITPLKGLKIHIDTVQGEYLIGLGVGLPFFKSEPGLAAEVEWKDPEKHGFVPDSVEIGLKLEKGIKLPTAIPSEIDEFKVRVSDINTAIEQGNGFALVFTGSVGIKGVKIKEYLPGVEKFLGDVSLLELPADDTQFSLRLSPFKLEAKAKLKFLSFIELAEAEAKIGAFPYSSSLLELDNADVAGLCAKVKTGIMIKDLCDCIDLDLSGDVELDAMNRFGGGQIAGRMDYDFRFWCFHTSEKVEGKMAIGVYQKHNGDFEFVAVFRGEDGGKTAKKVYYIDKNGHLGSGGSLN